MRCVSALGLVAAVGFTPWSALAWQPIFALPDAGWLAPGDTLSIAFEGDLPADSNQQLQLELDAFDVTDRVSWSEQGLSYAPAEPLTPGEHELRLVAFTESGEIIELGVWTFEVRQSSRFREMSLASAAELSYLARIADDNLDPRPPASIGQASASFEAALAGSDGSLGMRASLVHDSSLAADKTQLYDLLLTADSDSGGVRLQLGQHALQGANLVRQDFLRRGASASWLAGRAEVAGYVQRTNTLAGSRDPFGLGRRDNLTTGVSARFSPFADEPRRLLLQAEWLRAQGSETGVAEFGEEQAARGDAWSLAADSYFLDGLIRAYGEYARSAYDYDGAGTGATVSDDAVHVLLQYLPVSGERFAWNATLQWQQVGSRFRSLANAALPNDKRVLSVLLQTAMDDYSANLQLAEERDNVVGFDALPTIATSVRRLDLAYSPQEYSEESDAFMGGVFANPALQLSYAEAVNRQVRAPALFQGAATDNDSQDLQLSAAFTPGAWNWSMAWQFNRFDDAVNVSPDTRNTLLSFNLGMPVGDWLFVSPSWQTGRAKDLDAGVAQDELTYGVSLNMASERWSASLDYARTRYDSADVNFQSNSQSLGLVLNYRLAEPRGWRPGVELFVNANWSEQGGALTVAVPVSQIYLGLRTTLAGGNGL